MLEKYHYNTCGEIILGDDSFSDLKGNNLTLKSTWSGKPYNPDPDEKDCFTKLDAKEANKFYHMDNMYEKANSYWRPKHYFQIY